MGDQVERVDLHGTTLGTVSIRHVRSRFNRPEQGTRPADESPARRLTRDGAVAIARTDSPAYAEASFHTHAVWTSQWLDSDLYNCQWHVLEMSVEEALAFFAKIPKLRRRLQTLHDVGLDYMRLGQPATTLSGGEAQRVKLAAELCKVATGRTLYILDEPTTGLHFADIEKLLEVLQRLVDAGNTVLVIEHNLDVIKQADWIVDLGPEGGEAGGEVIAVGTPEDVSEVEGSYTGQFLRAVLAEPAAAAA